MSFAHEVATKLRTIKPALTLQEVGDERLLVNNRSLDLSNLKRMVDHDPERAETIITDYLAHLFSQNTVPESLTWEQAQARIFPRIQPLSIFDLLNQEEVAHTEFVNNTVITYVLDAKEAMVSLRNRDLKKWGKTLSGIHTCAIQNLTKLSDHIEVQRVESKEGGRAVIITAQDGYDASRLLLPELWSRFTNILSSTWLGRRSGQFYVCTPSRDMFLAFSMTPAPFVRRLLERVALDYKCLPYPIVATPFVVTRDGIAG